MQLIATSPEHQEHVAFNYFESRHGAGAREAWRLMSRGERAEWITTAMQKLEEWAAKPDSERESAFRCLVQPSPEPTPGTNSIPMPASGIDHRMPAGHPFNPTASPPSQAQPERPLGCAWCSKNPGVLHNGYHWHPCGSCGGVGMESVACVSVPRDQRGERIAPVPSGTVTLQPAAQRMSVKHPTPEEMARSGNEAKMADVVTAAHALVQEFGRGPKAGRPDYTIVMPCDRLTPLTTAIDTLFARQVEGASTPAPTEPRSENWLADQTECRRGGGEDCPCDWHQRQRRLGVTCRCGHDGGDHKVNLECVNFRECGCHSFKPATPVSEIQVKTHFEGGQEPAPTPVTLPATPAAMFYDVDIASAFKRGFDFGRSLPSQGPAPDIETLLDEYDKAWEFGFPSDVEAVRAAIRAAFSGSRASSQGEK